jgi:hypothetical protein
MGGVTSVRVIEYDEPSLRFICLGISILCGIDFFRWVFVVAPRVELLYSQVQIRLPGSESIPIRVNHPPDWGVNESPLSVSILNSLPQTSGPTLNPQHQ